MVETKAQILLAIEISSTLEVLAFMMKYRILSSVAEVGMFPFVGSCGELNGGGIGHRFGLQLENGDLELEDPDE